jgi:hypothetical protein
MKALDRDFGLHVSGAAAFLGRPLTEVAKATLAAQEEARPESGAALDLVFQGVSGFPTWERPGGERPGDVEPPEVSDHGLVRPGFADETGTPAPSSEADGTADQTDASLGWRGVLARAGALAGALGVLVGMGNARRAARRKDNPDEKENDLGRRV